MRTTNQTPIVILSTLSNHRRPTAFSFESHISLTATPIQNVRTYIHEMLFPPFKLQLIFRYTTIIQRQASLERNSRTSSRFVRPDLSRRFHRRVRNFPNIRARRRVPVISRPFKLPTIEEPIFPAFSVAKRVVVNNGEGKLLYRLLSRALFQNENAVQ